MAAGSEATAIEQAVKVYLDRDARRSHPAGKQDGGGRWYPAAEEERTCCMGVRPPSRSWPEGRAPAPGRVAYSVYGHPLLGLAPVAAEVGRAIATP